MTSFQNFVGNLHQDIIKTIHYGIDQDNSAIIAQVQQYITKLLLHTLCGGGYH